MRKLILLIIFLSINVFILLADGNEHSVFIGTGLGYQGAKKLPLSEKTFDISGTLNLAVTYQLDTEKYLNEIVLFYQMGNDAVSENSDIDFFIRKNSNDTDQFGISLLRMRKLLPENLFFINIGLEFRTFFEHQNIYWEDEVASSWSVEYPSWWYHAMLLPTIRFGLESDRFSAGFTGGVSIARYSLFAENRNTPVGEGISERMPDAGPSCLSSFNDYLEWYVGFEFKLFMGDHWMIFIAGQYMYREDRFDHGETIDSLSIHSGAGYRF